MKRFAIPEGTRDLILGEYYCEETIAGCNRTGV